MLPVTLLDYGVGNIHSIAKSFERAGAKVAVETDPAKILSARALVLPGVGAFGKVAQQIAPYRTELRERLRAGLPAFAVCIGMQILYESSEEGPGEGIGLFPDASGGWATRGFRTSDGTPSSIRARGRSRASARTPSSTSSTRTPLRSAGRPASRRPTTEGVSRPRRRRVASGRSSSTPKNRATWAFA